MNKKRGCLSIILVIAIIIAGLWWLMQRTTFKPASEVAPAIILFVNQPELMVRKQRTQEFGTIQISQYTATLDNGDKIIFGIDEEGNLAGFFRENQIGVSVIYSQENARQAALDFAQNQVGDNLLTSTSPDYAQLTEGITNYKFYDFKWIERDEASGAILPHSVTVQVNAQTGQVDGYSRISLPVIVPTQPNIEKQQAEQIALETAESLIPDVTITETYLVVTNLPLYSPDAIQYLVWHIVVQGKEDDIGYIPVADIFVDALTGEIIQLEPRL